MRKRQYQSPVNQGTNVPGGMTYDEWWEDIAWEGANPDADYNGDGDVNEDDYNFYIDNELWKGEE